MWSFFGSASQELGDQEIHRLQASFWLYWWLVILEGSNLCLELVVELPNCLLLTDDILAIESYLLPIAIWLGLLFLHLFFHIGEHMKELIFVSPQWLDTGGHLLRWEGVGVLSGMRLIVGGGTVPPTVRRPCLWTLRCWRFAFLGPPSMKKSFCKESFLVFRREILSVGIQLSMKAAVCGEDFLLWMIRWSIHTTRKRGSLECKWKAIIITQKIGWEICFYGKTQIGKKSQGGEEESTIISQFARITGITWSVSEQGLTVKVLIRSWC